MKDYQQDFLCGGRWLKGSCNCTFSPTSFHGLALFDDGPVGIGTSRCLVSRAAWKRVEASIIPNARSWERESKSVANGLREQRQPTLGRRGTRMVYLAQRSGCIAAAKFSLQRHRREEITAIAVDHSWFTANEKKYLL